MSHIKEISLTSSTESTPSSSPALSPHSPPVISISPTPWKPIDLTLTDQLPEDEQSKSPNITDSLGPSAGSVSAQFGYYDIRHIVGVQKVKFQGKIRKIAEVEWCKSIIDFDNIETYDKNDSIPYGISSEAKELLKKMDPKTSFYVEQSYLCRFCRTTFYSRGDGINHEKGCTVPGGPGHKCRSTCSRSCRGRGIYVPKNNRPKRKSFRYTQPKNYQRNKR